jgi:levanase/fructan beta-fructosidase
MQYFVGNFDGEKFTSDHPTDTMSVVDYGDAFYAAIPWNGLPADKNIYIGWLVPGPQQTHPWKGQMSIPRDLSLKTTSEGIRLIQTPAAVIKNSLGQLVTQKPLLRKNIKLGDKEIDIRKPGQHKQNTYWLEAAIDMGTAAQFGLKIASNKKDDETIITYDKSVRKLLVDRSKSPNGKIREGREKQEVNVIGSGSKIRFEILVDNSSLEIFVNDGEEVLTTLVFPGKGATGLSLFARGGQANVEVLKVWDMSSLKPSAL